MDNDTDIDIEAAGTGTPIACTLTPKETTKQALEWVDLQHRATDVTAIEGGI